MKNLVNRKIKRTAVWFTCLIVAFQMTIGVNAATATIPTKIIPQLFDEKCCWACCGTSVCQYYGINISLDQFIQSVKGSTSHKLPGSLTDIAAGLNLKGIRSSAGGTDGLGFSTVTDEIDAGRPIICSTKYYNGTSQPGDHAIIISGYDTISPRKYRVTDSLESNHRYYSVDGMNMATIPLSVDNPYKIQTYRYRIMFA